MLIVHTSDWHAGKAWKNVDRLAELDAVLDDLAGFVEREKVDLLLHTGDVFDTKTRTLVTQLTDEEGRIVQSEKMLEIDFLGDHPVRAGDQFGLGRVR